VPRGAGPPPGEPVQSPKPRTRPGDWGSGACQSGLISRTGERLVDLGSTTGLADRELDRERDRGRDRGRDRDPGSTSGRFEDDDESPAHLPRPPDLAGRVAVVTGGSRGIGAGRRRRRHRRPRRPRQLPCALGGRERHANLDDRTAAPGAGGFVPASALRRIGQPDDVAAATLFLASDASSWITGITLDIAGGKIMGLARPWSTYQHAGHATGQRGPANVVAGVERLPGLGTTISATKRVTDLCWSRLPLSGKGDPTHRSESAGLVAKIWQGVT
jgi:hypothetical protein